MKSVTPVLFFFFSLSAWALPALDPDKYTVCTMTMNSSNEREVFREQVRRDPAHFNPIVELTDFSGSDWFQAACRSGVRCDQLVISGHFTDGFGGTSDDDGVRRSLRLDDMERMGCQNTCDGILDHPYEVFLLGCNTLATKAADNRTPEVYLNTLVEDGVPRSRAELIVEARYGTMGESNRSRIQRAFRGQKKMLYGFDARGPSGATIEDMLRDYFSLSSLRAGLRRAENARTVATVHAMNTLLAESLELTAFEQCEAGRDTDRDSKICALRNPQLSIDRRLAVIEEALQGDDWFRYVPAINRFFRQNPPAQMTPAQKRTIASLASNDVIGRQARSLAQTAAPAVRAEWNFFANTIGFLARPALPLRENDPIGDIIGGTRDTPVRPPARTPARTPAPTGRIGPDFLRDLPPDPPRR